MKKHESRVEKQIEYGIFKFKIPNKNDRTNAMGLVGESTLLKKILTYKLEDHYELIDPPEIGDWLMTHKEFGQTFEEFKKNYYKITKEKNTIYLVSISYSQNSSMNPDFIIGLKILAESFFYGCKIKLINKIYDLDTYKIATKMNSESGKIQISSLQIANILYSEMPSDAYCVIAFTDQDLFDGEYSMTNQFNDQVENEDNDEQRIESQINNKDLDKIDEIVKENEKLNHIENEEENNTGELLSNIPLSHSFTFGYSSIKQRVSIFSFARYDPLFYSQDFSKKGGQEMIQKFFSILLKRSCKVLVNKIGQMMGLKNCIYYRCGMNGFNSMEEFDKKPIEFCPICLRKIYYIICNRGKENSRITNAELIYDRFIKMKDSLGDHFSGIFDYEKTWFETRVDDLSEEL